MYTISFGLLGSVIRLQIPDVSPASMVSIFRGGCSEDAYHKRGQKSGICNLRTQSPSLTDIVYNNWFTGTGFEQESPALHTGVLLTPPLRQRK